MIPRNFSLNKLPRITHFNWIKLSKRYSVISILLVKKLRQLVAMEGRKLLTRVHLSILSTSLSSIQLIASRTKDLTHSKISWPEILDKNHWMKITIDFPVRTAAKVESKELCRKPKKEWKLEVTATQSWAKTLSSTNSLGKTKQWTLRRADNPKSSLSNKAHQPVKMGRSASRSLLSLQT